MSNGKIYGVVSDGSVDPLTRISELERLWPIIQSRLSAYDGLVSDVEAMRKEIITIKQKHEDLKEDVNVVDGSAKDAVAYAQSRIDFHAQSTLDSQKPLQEAISAHKSFILQIQTDAQNIKSGLEEFKSQVFNGLASNVSKDQLQDHKDQTTNSLNVVRDVIGDLASKLAEVKAGLSVVKTGFQNHADALSTGLGAVNDVEGQMKSLASAYESYKTYVSTLIYNESKKVSDHVEAKIKDLKSSSSPVAAVNALREEFVKKLEGVALDGTNAVLRSSNATNQITLLEKKIENILLRLKAVELPKA